VGGTVHINNLKRFEIIFMEIWKWIPRYAHGANKVIFTDIGGDFQIL